LLHVTGAFICIWGVLNKLDQGGVAANGKSNDLMGNSTRVHAL